jgi:hypothetical protein
MRREMTSRPAPQEAYASLVSLMELLQPEVDALFYCLREIERPCKKFCV